MVTWILNSLPVIFFVFIIWLAWYGYKHDKRDWNGGICKESGKPWRYFDTASDGSMGFTDDEGHYIWISFHSVIGKE